MKTLKIFFLFLFTAIVFCSCEKDDGIDDNGSTVDLFVGSWRVSDNELKINYDVTIEKDENNYSEVLMHGFADAQSTTRALITNRTITIETQLIGNSWQVRGSGYLITNDLIEISYTLIISGSSESRKAVFTRN
ncbi:MAG: hypothetical protein LBM67_00870 [Lentimicrobiaceae bacterium]|jgi:hypothetical protein|nr:hypothetical protein [Lentimicrobiaceae bacterium]